MSNWSCGSAFSRRTSLLAGVAACAILAVPSLASAQVGCPNCTYQTNLGFFGPIPGNPLTSFDISWVDSASQRSDSNDFNNYYLADRSNASVDVIKIGPNPQVFKITPTGANAFAGNTGNNNTAGPNGIITFKNPQLGRAELWAGDGPTANPECPAAQPVCSTVKVFTGTSATLTATIPTGTGVPPFVGKNRADELCYDSANNIVEVANDADDPPFITFINATTDKVIGRAAMNGGGTSPLATNGIEQCEWDHTHSRFVTNIPEVGGPGDDSANGAVIVVNSATVLQSTTNGVTPVDATVSINAAECAGPQGMAMDGQIGGADVTQILLGCNAQTTPSPTDPLSGPQNSLIIDATNGRTKTVLENQGGSDEVWFEATGGVFFLANGSQIPAQTVGIVDAATGTPIQNAFVGFSGTTTRRSHSVAGWNGTIQTQPPTSGISVAFVPISQIGGAATGGVGFASTVCVNPAANATAQGCIGIFSNAGLPMN